jgi:hypothetical protein
VSTVTPAATLSGEPGSPRWRYTLHRRCWSSTDSWQSTLITELVHGYGRRLERKLNTAAQAVVTLDGRTWAAAQVQELRHDLMAWRLSETSGNYVPYFRGVIAQAEDQITEDAHVVTFTAHDYFAMVQRRWRTPGTWSQISGGQDGLVDGWIAAAVAPTQAGGGGFGASGFLPLVSVYANPDGSDRSSSGTNGPFGPGRIMDQPGGMNYGTAIDDMAHVINGFDYDIETNGHSPWGTGNADRFRNFFPNQGVTRTRPVLVYGSNVVSLTRSLNSAQYANYWRSLGNNQAAATTTPQLISEALNSDASLATPTVGTWEQTDQPTDIITQGALDDHAKGQLGIAGTLTPTYTLKLRPRFYSEGLFNMGDVLTLMVRSGRLNVTNQVRIVELHFTPTEDGTEDVEIVVGQPLVTMTTQYLNTQKQIQSLARK